MVAEHDLADAAYVALIRGFGHDCASVDLDEYPAGAMLLPGTRAVVARSARGLVRARAPLPTHFWSESGSPTALRDRTP